VTKPKPRNVEKQTARLIMPIVIHQLGRPWSHTKRCAVLMAVTVATTMLGFPLGEIQTALLGLTREGVGEVLGTGKGVTICPLLT